MKLVDDWKDAWKWALVNFMVLTAAVQGAWLYIPDDMRSTIPSCIVSGLTIGLLVLGIIGRLTQKGSNDTGA